MNENSRYKKGHFLKIIATFPELLKKLEDSDSYERDTLPAKLTQGIYVFYENGNPLYVGRCGREGRFKQRILEHSRPSSGHNTATFAYLIAQQNSQNKKDLEKSRKENEKDPKFIEAKERVSKMQIKVIEIKDPVTQTLFEVYSALELNTPFNEWGTH